MKKVLCDTNVFIHFYNGDVETSDELERIGLENVIMPSVSAMELFRGMRNKNELARMKSRIKNYNILHISAPVSQQALRFLEEFRLSHDLNLPDALIGAMTVVFKVPLFTYNLKDFQYLPNIILYETKD